MASEDTGAGWRKFVMEQNAPALQPGPITEAAAPTPIGAGFLSPPSFDPIELLPERAQARLRKLRLRKADTHKLVPEFEQIREASLARIEAENRLKQLQDHPQNHGFNLPPTDARIIAQQKVVGKLTDDFRRLQELQAVRSAAFEAAGTALASVETWLKSGRPGNTTLEDVTMEPPQLRKGESLLDGVERARHRGRELKADLARVEAAAYPVAEARAVAMAQIAALHQRGELDTSGCVEHLEPIRFPTKQVQALVHNSNSPGAVVFVEVIDAEAVIAHLLRPQLVAAVEASIAADADEPNALGQSEREKRAAVISQDLLICEREEAALTWEAQAQNLPIEHRSDISPLALLGLQLITAPRATEMPATSTGYSWPWMR